MRIIGIRALVFASAFFGTSWEALSSGLPWRDEYSLADVWRIVDERAWDARNRVLRESGKLTNNFLTDLTDLCFMVPAPSATGNNSAQNDPWNIAFVATVVEELMRNSTESELVEFLNKSRKMLPEMRKAVEERKMESGIYNFVYRMVSGRHYILFRKLSRMGLGRLYSLVREAIQNNGPVNVDLAHLVERMKERGGNVPASDGHWSVSTTCGDISIRLELCIIGSEEKGIKLKTELTGSESLNGWRVEGTSNIPCGDPEDLTWAELLRKVFEAPAKVEGEVKRITWKNFGDRKFEDDPIRSAFAIWKRALRTLSIDLATLLFVFTR